MNKKVKRRQHQVRLMHKRWRKWLRSKARGK